MLPETVLREPQSDRAPRLEIRKRAWSRIAMHWIRRIHLFSGLFMFPWVMLYGLTALLFNHPTAFRDQVQRTLGHAEFAGTALDQPADPVRDAVKVIDALNAKFPSEGPELRYRLIEPDKARYLRDTVAARVRGPGQDHAVTFDLPSGIASIATTIQNDADQPQFAVRGLKVSGSLGERMKAGLPEALTRLGLAADDAGIAIGTPLLFHVEGDGRRWTAAYNVQTGAVTGRPVESANELSWRRFLTELHQAHAYPSKFTAARWFWAIAVDGMFVSMTFWGVSGLFMWWQIKAVRRAGAVVLVLSLIVASLLALGMHGALGG